MLRVKVYADLGKISIRSNYKNLKEEYDIEFIGNKIIVKNITNSKTKLSYTEKTFEYENDILIRETEKIIDKADNNIISENEAIYDCRMKMLLRKNKSFVMNDLNKKEKTEYEATSFIESVNFDSKKNPNPNYSYLNLHLPFVEITEQDYENAIKRLFQKEQGKQKLLNKN